MNLRVRLSLTSLEERDTPSVPGPMDPGGTSPSTDPTVPAQTSPPATNPTVDPHTSK